MAVIESGEQWFNCVLPSGGVDRGLLAALSGGSEFDLIEAKVGRTANDVKTLGLIRDDERGGGSGIDDV